MFQSAPKTTSPMPQSSKNAQNLLNQIPKILLKCCLSKCIWHRLMFYYIIWTFGACEIFLLLYVHVYHLHWIVFHNFPMECKLDRNWTFVVLTIWYDFFYSIWKFKMAARPINICSLITGGWYFKIFISETTCVLDLLNSTW